MTLPLRGLLTSWVAVMKGRPSCFACAAAARAAGEQYGVAFLYRDFRPLFQEGQQFARDHGFYMQKYCGCIFSEEERYMAAKWKKKQSRI